MQDKREACLIGIKATENETSLFDESCLFTYIIILLKLRRTLPSAPPPPKVPKVRYFQNHKWI